MTLFTSEFMCEFMCVHSLCSPAVCSPTGSNRRPIITEKVSAHFLTTKSISVYVYVLFVGWLCVGGCVGGSVCVGVCGCLCVCRSLGVDRWMMCVCLTCVHAN